MRETPMSASEIAALPQTAADRNEEAHANAVLSRPKRDHENNAIRCYGPVLVRQHYETRTSSGGSHSVMVPVWQVYRSRVDGGVRILIEKPFATGQRAITFAKGYAAALGLTVMVYSDDGELLSDYRV